MEVFRFSDVRRFRVRLPEPLLPYPGRASVAAATLEDLPIDSSGWLGLQELSELFTPNFSKRNPLNIPGPIYGAETDTCFTGPTEAPSNVLLDKGGQEFVFKQASNPVEFRDLISAALCECFQGYGADGDEHWKLSNIREWWRGRWGLIGEIDEEDCNPESVRQYRAALHGEAENYLREYAYFVENGRIPNAGDRLPDLA